MYVAVPLIAFAVVSWLLWHAFGVRDANDTPFFLAAARSLRAGRLANDASVSYLGYLAFLGLFQTLGLGAGAIVLAQWLISGCVVVATYDFGRRLAGPVSGSIAATLYALNADISRFTFYVLSDSLFASTLLLAVYATYRAASRRSRGWTIAAAGLCLALASTRTNGLLMFPILMEWLIRSSALSPANRWTARIGLGACVAACMAIGSARIGASQVTYDFLRQGRVIWLDQDSWIAMPPTGAPRPGWPPAVDYAVRHPLAVADLMSRRVIVEVAHTRRFYSRSHNAIVAATVWSLYLLAAAGWWVHRRQAVARVTWLLITMQLFIVAMTAADWDGRFIITVLPLVTVWSGVGLARTMSALEGAVGARPRLAGTP